MNLTLILSLIQAAATLLPEIQTVLPTVETILNGGTVSAEEEAAISAAIVVLNAQVTTAVAVVEGNA